MIKLPKLNFNHKGWAWKYQVSPFVFFIILAIPFFIITSGLYKESVYIFNSPDENAAYIFAKHFAQTGSLQIKEPLNSLTPGFIHPRSSWADSEYIRPTGFVGFFIIVGFLMKIMGVKMVIFFIPLLSSLIPFFLYSIFKKIFKPSVAFWGALLLYIHPAFVYFSARGFLPNVLFVDLLILGFYFLFKLDKKTGFFQLFWTLIAGGALGLAVTVRPNEIFWVIPLGVVWLWFYRNKLNIQMIAGIFLAGILFMMPFFLLNHSLYGHIFSSGYQNTNVINTSGHNEQFLNSKESLKINPWVYVFPFGINLFRSAGNVYSYYIFLLSWWFISMVLGLIFMVRRGVNKKEKVYICLFCLIGLYLFVYYGSWSFIDNINKTITIGNSYLRYWLPVFIMSLPLVANAILTVAKNRKKRLLIFFVFVWACFFTAIDYSQESLRDVKENIHIYKYEKQQVLKNTPQNALIITDRADKIIYPQRSVMVLSGRTYQNIVQPVVALLSNGIPVYFYDQLQNKDMLYLNQTVFKKFGIQGKPLIEINANHRLFKMVLEK